MGRQYCFGRIKIKFNNRRFKAGKTETVSTESPPLKDETQKIRYKPEREYIKKYFKEEGFMKVYHKPEMTIERFSELDVMTLSGDQGFNNNWFDNTSEEESV